MMKEMRWLEPLGASISVVTMKFLLVEIKYKGYSQTQGHTKYMTKEVEIPIRDKAYNDEDKMNIYEGNSKAWYFLIISFT